MPFVLLNQQERLEFEHEGAVIYYHRLGHDARARIAHATTERGTQNLQDYWLLTCQEAVDGWANIYDADMQPVPVPSEPEQRKKIAELVSFFPLEALSLLATEALADSPQAIKKRFSVSYPDVLPSPTNGQDASLPVETADASAAKSD